MINVVLEIDDILEHHLVEKLDNSLKLVNDVANACISSDFLKIKNQKWEVYIFITSNQEIKNVNEQTRKINEATDVLSFPLLELSNGQGVIQKSDSDPDTGNILLGDIIISVEKTCEQALEYEHSFDRELAFLVSHGMFHLMGYDHITENEEKIMIEAQEEILNSLSYRRM